MKWTVRYGAAAALFGMSAVAQAGLLGGLFSSHGSNGCCEQDCCEQPARPIVARPCEQTYIYQRKCSDLQPPCCEEDCCEEPACAAPCDAACVAPCGDGCGHGGCGVRKRGCNLLKGLFGGHRKGGLCANGGLCGNGAGCCDTGCAEECGPPTDCGDPCEIARLMYEAQTSCYADDRADAVDDLGDFDCRCHPEIMTILVYSLNDADEDVRKQAADEIGDLLEDGRCCCSPEVVAALTCALGDCDDDVRHQAEEALEVCGYDVVEGCCDSGCCDTACGTTGGHAAPVSGAVPAQSAPVPPTAPAPPAPMKKEAAPAPAPPEDPEAYFPSRFRKQTSRQGALTNLFGMKG